MTRPHPLTRLSLALVAVTVSAASCSSFFDPDSSFHINVGYQNSTAVPLTIETRGGRISGTDSRTYDPGYTARDFSGTSGDRLTFTVAGPSGYSGTGSCIATNAIVGTNEYGQVNFIAEGTTVTVQCSSGWRQ